MGILPLQFTGGDGWASLGLDGTETFDIKKNVSEVTPRCIINVSAKKKKKNGKNVTFDVLCRLDTDVEIEYFKHGGILAYVLRGGMAKG